MQWWRFFHPAALAFTMKTASQSLVDTIKGAPPRTVQSARHVEQHAIRDNPRHVLYTLDRLALEER
ncbi:MAG: hypothetical protein HRT77_00405 [Halioglobus sp.]|nr:hypothetical protein [Halioglobus sp.]